MASKKKSENVESNSWLNEVEKYSRQIWLAGLGAYAKASKDGAKLFDGLVEDGAKAEELAKGAVEQQVKNVESAKDKAVDAVESVKDKALGKWNALEEAFDRRLNSAVSRLGVPSRSEVRELQKKVDELTKLVKKLTDEGKKPAAAKPAVKAPAAKPAVAAKPAAAKPAAKPAAKKPAAKKPAAPKAAAKPAAKPAEAAKPAAPAAAPATPSSNS